MSQAVNPHMPEELAAIKERLKDIIDYAQSLLAASKLKSPEATFAFQASMFEAIKYLQLSSFYFSHGLTIEKDDKKDAELGGISKN